jgi:NADPH-dependent curcumin reductase CurA
MGQYMSAVNRKVVLASAIEGVPRADNFQVVESPLPRPGDGEFLIKHAYLSLDPYQRSAIAGVHMSADRALDKNEAPSAEIIGCVIESNHPDYSVGDIVRHFGGWQEYSVSTGEKASVIDPSVAPLSTHLGVLGMPGLTAYASVVKLADVKPGQKVLVSAATGPVGSMVGQLARQLGAEPYGIAGSEQKCAYAINELGFIDCVNYKDSDYPQSLSRSFAEGFDFYHDNVGGQMLTDAFGALRNYGTVVLCGLISQYNTTDEGQGFNIAPAIIKRAVVKGLVVYDYEGDRQEFLDLAAPWVQDGAIKYKEDRAVGIENVGAHFERLMSGQNFGKSLVVLDENFDN